MNILELDTSNPAHLRRFLRLPFRLYRGCPQWVPPLEMDARRMLDRRAHPFYRHSDAAFFLAEENGEDIGRLAVLNNLNFNQYNRTRAAFFYLFECLNRPDAAQALFEAASAWARARGLDEMLGPKGFTALDGMGLLVEGFQHRPAIGIPYNLPYYAALIEAAGFASDGDTLSGHIDRSFSLPEKVRRAAHAAQERRGLRVMRFRTRRDLRAIVPRLKDMYNGALEGTTGTCPLTDDEAQGMAEQILWFADPRLIKIVLKGDDLAGFLFAYPDISAAIQRAGGRLAPFGWAGMLLELRRTRWLNINGAGMLAKYRGSAGTAILFNEIYESFISGGFEHADIVQIGAGNERMQNEMRSLNVDFYKVHRGFKKKL